MTVYELLENTRWYITRELLTKVADALAKQISLKDDQFPNLDNEFVLQLFEKAIKHLEESNKCSRS